MARSILTDAERLAWERFPADPDPDAIGIYFTLADVLVDVDAWTQFSDELTHAHGATPRQPRLREHRYAALLAHACNLGYARMGQAARIDPQQLAWITQWYLRPEALAAANARIVNAHHNLPLAQEWGEGRFSSSDGKRYPVGVDSPEARAVSRYFGRGRGVTFYVWTSDQHSHYATRVVRTTVRDATYVLDGILDNQTELPIEKHTTDTAGYSDIIFALFDLLGLQFAPRLAGLPDRRLFHPGAVADTPAGRLLAHPLNLDVIREGWDDLVRCAASLKDGTVTASLLVARLQAAGGKLPLTRALQEYGRLVKTRFVLGYLADETEPARSAASKTRARAYTRCMTGSSTATTAPCACTPSSANPHRRTACTSSPTRSSTGTRSTPSTPSTPSRPSPPATSERASHRRCSSTSTLSAQSPSTPAGPPDSYGH
jgi:TnpA family transposase